jgi:hypothetical protein
VELNCDIEHSGCSMDTMGSLGCTMGILMYSALGI